MMKIKATELSTALGCSGSRLADGTFLTWVSIQRRAVYVHGLHPSGRVVKRRYRHDQMVEVSA